MAFLVETHPALVQEFMESHLRGGVAMDYQLFPFKKWIWQCGEGMANILNTLIFFAQTRPCP
jgi:hypothetical protein